uniref:Rabenosyn-5 n=1 Tax=Aceria tosichella TaxID=561515 RepID=A0A6G1SCB0_9ACAR
MFYRGWIKSSKLKIIDTFGDGHQEAFEQKRRKHNDNICAETNKLVLRLDKLINPENSTTPDLDKSIVEWTLDDLVKLCPYCAKSFTFARRRHHCRVCGAILCGGCSKYLEYKAAYKLVKPAKLYTDPYDRIEDVLEKKSTEEMQNIRTCEDCKRLLDKRVQLIEDHYCQPTFLDIYESLRKSMIEADELMLSQASISSGQKETALELKTKIQEMRQEIAAKSSKIKKMADRDPNGKQAYLLGAISQSVVYWLQESISGKINRLPGKFQGTRQSGWVSEQLGAIDDDENPLLVQIKNLEEYIKQAKLADRYEEISILEANKRDLEIEYLIQQQISKNIE